MSVLVQSAQPAMSPHGLGTSRVLRRYRSSRILNPPPVLEPSSNAPAPPPPSPGERPPHAHLLDQVRSLQRRALWAQGLLLGAATGVAFLVAGGLTFASLPWLGRALCWAAGPAALGVMLAFGVWLARRRVGDDARTARLLAE